MSELRCGIVRFLGTNCDRDVWQAIEMVGGKPSWIWYQNQFSPQDFDLIVLPGGFSYGDYLRSGALAARSPVMNSVREAAKRGVRILGICNGFQILTEAGLLPGALLRNESQRFQDRWVHVQVASQRPGLWVESRRLQENLRLPIAHADGRYFVKDDHLKALQDQDLIWLTYASNPNGSVADIAGVMNESANVFGLMPHPERAMADWMGSSDGKRFFS